MTVAIILSVISLGLSIYGLAYAAVVGLEFRKLKRLRETETYGPTLTELPTL